MNLKKTMFLSILFAFVFCTSAYANSGPLVYEKAPGFSLAPKGETCIAVEKEDLTYDLSGGDGRTARVKASYEMKNTSDKDVEQVMLFPFVTSYSEGFTRTVSITANGVPVKFKTFRLDDISYTNDYKSLNYKDSENKQLANDISMDNIIKMLNQAEKYKPQNFDPEQRIVVYTLHLPQKSKDYEAAVSFKVVPKEQSLLYYRANGFEYHDDGTGKFTMWRMKNSTEAAEEYCFAVIGKDNQGEFKSLTGEDITAKEETIEEFLKGYKVDDNSGKYMNIDLKDIDLNELYDYNVKKLDSQLSQKANVISVGDDLLGGYAKKTYIGAFLYTVNFKPNSSMNMTVEYNEKATQDMRKTKNYSYMFLYLLRPASGWKSFSNLTVSIIPSESSPYITGSSITLAKDSKSGIYSGKFDSLPDKDLYFTTYKTDKPDLPPISIHIPYRFAIMLQLFSLILIIIIVVIAIKRKMKSKFE